MPLSKKVSFRKRRPYKKKRYVKRKKHNSAWLTIPTLGMPYNMVTYLQYNSKTMNYNIPQDSPTGSSYWTTNGTSFALGLNLMNPVNLVHGVGLVPKPATDAQYFGIAPTPSSEGSPGSPLNGTFTYSQLSWWSNFYSKMRVKNVFVTIVIRPVQNADIPGPGQRAASYDPFSVQILDSKYISGLNTPENLAITDLDDLRSSRGCKTMTFSGQRNKPIVIKRKISIAKLLGVKDLADTGYETQCTINPDLTATTMANPTVRYSCFEFIRLSRPNIAATVDQNNPMRFSIQFKVVAKVHFSQLTINNPRSLVGSTGPFDDPNPETPQSPPPAEV